MSKNEKNHLKNKNKEKTQHDGGGFVDLKNALKMKPKAFGNKESVLPIFKTAATTNIHSKVIKEPVSVKEPQFENIFPDFEMSIIPKRSDINTLDSNISMISPSIFDKSSMASNIMDRGFMNDNLSQINEVDSQISFDTNTNLPNVDHSTFLPESMINWSRK